MTEKALATYQGQQEIAEAIRGINLETLTQKAVWVDSVADMRELDAPQGITVATRGYYSPNDGGNGFYYIRAKEVGAVDDGGSVIFLDNDNEAKLITDGTVNVKQFGAKGGANYYNYADNKWYGVKTGGSICKYYNPDDSSFYEGATYSTEGTYFKQADGNYYVDSAYTTLAPYYNVDDDKWYENAIFTNKANCFDSIDGKWYASVVFSGEAGDDVQPLQNAINFAKVIDLANDHYMLTATQLSIPSNKVIKNGGFVITQINAVSIGSTNTENITLKKVKIVHAFDPTNRLVWQVYFNGCSNIKLVKCETYAFACRNAQFLDISDLLIEDCYFGKAIGSSVQVSSCENATIKNCVFDGENIIYQLNAWHMLDLSSPDRDSINILILGCKFVNYRSNGMQFTCKTSYDVKNILVVDCQFQHYRSAGLKLDGVDNNVDIVNCQFDSGIGAIALSGSSGVADKVRIKNCTFTNMLGETIAHLNKSTDIFDYCIIENNYFNNCYRLVDLTQTSFNNVTFDNNIVENSGIYIYKGTSGNSKAFYCRNNKFIKPISATNITVTNTDYQEFCNNFFDTPISFLSSYEHNIYGGDTTPSIIRYEGNTFVNSVKTNIYVGYKIAVLFYNGNRMNGVVPTLGLSGSAIITEKVTYGLEENTSASAPSTGTHAVGEIVYNSTPTAGGNVGWICVTAGTPGTWKSFGTIEA